MPTSRPALRLMEQATRRNGRQPHVGIAAHCMGLMILSGQQAVADGPAVIHAAPTAPAAPLFEVQTTGEIGRGQPVLYGYVIDTAGRIFRYDDTGTRSGMPADTGKSSQICVSESAEKFRRRRVLLGQVPLPELQRQISVILPASWGRLEKSPAPAAGQFTRSYLAYQRAPGGGRCTIVRLRQTFGSEVRRNVAAAAGQLADWIESTIHPEALDRDITRLDGLPLDSLSVSCSGGIVASGWSVRLARDGSVESRRWGFDVGSKAEDHIDHVPRRQAAQLLGAAQRARLFRQELETSGEIVCGMQGEIGALSGTVSWPTEAQAPADFRAVFDAVKSLRGRAGRASAP